MILAELVFALSFATLCGNGEDKVERACQLALLAVGLYATKGTLLGSFFKVPVYMLVLFIGLFEFAHMRYKRKHAGMRATWNHLERLRGQADFADLLALSSHNEIMSITWSQLQRVLEQKDGTERNGPRDNGPRPRVDAR